MKTEILGNTIEVAIGSSTGHPDYKGIQTCDIKTWIRVNNGDWYRTEYQEGDLEFTGAVDLFHLALRLSAVTGKDVYQNNNGKLSFGEFKADEIF